MSAKNRIVVVVEGGVIQNVLTDDPATEVFVIDHDIDGIHIDELKEDENGGPGSQCRRARAVEGEN